MATEGRNDQTSLSVHIFQSYSEAYILEKLAVTFLQVRYLYFTSARPNTVLLLPPSRATRLSTGPELRLRCTQLTSLQRKLTKLSSFPRSASIRQERRGNGSGGRLSIRRWKFGGSIFDEDRGGKHWASLSKTLQRLVYKSVASTNFRCKQQPCI